MHPGGGPKTLPRQIDSGSNFDCELSKKRTAVTLLSVDLQLALSLIFAPMTKILDRLNERFLTRENVWSAIGLLAVVAGNTVGRHLLKAGYRATTGGEPPEDPLEDETNWGEALVWAVVTGALVGIVRTLSRHSARSARQRWS